MAQVDTKNEWQKSVGEKNHVYHSLSLFKLNILDRYIAFPLPLSVFEIFWMQCYKTNMANKAVRNCVQLRLLSWLDVLLSSSTSPGIKTDTVFECFWSFEPRLAIETLNCWLLILYWGLFLLDQVANIKIPTWCSKKRVVGPQIHLNPVEKSKASQNTPLQTSMNLFHRQWFGVDVNNFYWNHSYLRLRDLYVWRKNEVYPFWNKKQKPWKLMVGSDMFRWNVLLKWFRFCGHVNFRGCMYKGQGRLTCLE